MTTNKDVQLQDFACKISDLIWGGDLGWTRENGLNDLFNEVKKIRNALQTQKEKDDLWQMVVVQDTKEDEVSFVANWLRGQIKIPDEIKTRLIGNAQQTQAELVEALKELATLMDDVRTGDYEPDSFTTQPARQALARAEGRK